MRRCSHCQEEILQGVHSKKCREPDCRELLCDACYYRYRFCLRHETTSGAALKGPSGTAGDSGRGESGSRLLLPEDARRSLQNFESWLRFYTVLTDPTDMKDRTFSLEGADSFDGATAEATIAFRRGSTVRLFWMCSPEMSTTRTGGVDEGGSSEEKKPAKIGRADPSGHVCVGIFSPPGRPEPSAGKLPGMNFGEARVSVIRISATSLEVDKGDRVAGCMKPFFVPWSIAESEHQVRKVITGLFDRYIRVRDVTVMEAADVPRELVIHIAGRMAEEGRCRIEKTGKGVDLIRPDC